MPEPDPPASAQLLPSKEAQVAGTRVRRALPQRLGPQRRRTVGAWCFADHMGPAAVTRDAGMDVGPHPHIGLQTVTWLTAGELLHRDSLGSEQVIRPGQLNLMTAGHGVSHAEESTHRYTGRLEGIQLWVAQPEATRHGAPAFEHHRELPVGELREPRGSADVTVLVGAFDDLMSPARRDTDHVGLDVTLRSGAVTLPVRTDFEYAVIVLEGAVMLQSSGKAPVRAVPGELAHLGSGVDEVSLSSAGPAGGSEGARLVLLGGTVFEAPVHMWWNFVARSRAEIAAARDDWQSGGARFGHTTSPLALIPAPELPAGYLAGRNG